MLKLRKNKKGFTLVELIVVVAIMAVLAGTVAGVVVSTQNKTKNSQADASAQGIAKQIADLINQDYQNGTKEYAEITVTTSSGTTTTTIDLKDKIKTDIAASYDAGAINPTTATDAKAGANKYNVTIIAKNETTDIITVTYTTLGSSKAAKGYTVSYDSTSDTFKVAAYDATKDKAA